MRMQGIPTQRGVALLVVLATLVLALTASTIVISAAATLQAQKRIEDWAIEDDELLKACEAPIQHWLANESPRVVLPTEALSPQVKVLHDRIRIDHQDYEITISAWDQCGMLPMDVAGSSSPLRLAVSGETLRRLDTLRMATGSPLGLDLLAEESSDSTPNVFPNAISTTSAQFGQNDASEDIEQIPAEGELDRRDTPVIGALVATHNRNPFRINVNTAPRGLVEAAIRAAGHGDVDQVIAARRNGKLASVGSSTARQQKDSGNSIQLVGKSAIWSFRIDIRVGNLRRSWWATYVPASKISATSRNKNQNSEQPKWECVQRLAITI